METDWKKGERKDLMGSLDVVLSNIKTKALLDLMNVVDREDGSFSPDLTLRVSTELLKRKAKRNGRLSKL